MVFDHKVLFSQNFEKCLNKTILVTVIYSLCLTKECSDNRVKR